MVSNDKQFLFIDIVKTGGTNVSKIVVFLGGSGSHFEKIGLVFIRNLGLN